jgi:DNA-binding transcriptional LysR family regulator
MTARAPAQATPAMPHPGKIDLRQLEQFLAVVDQGSFRGASRVLNMAQPALSRNVRHIETMLGVRLFERNRRGVTPTPAGATLADGARRLRGDVSELVARTVRAGRGMVGELCVGYTDFAIVGTLPRIIKAFRHQYPGVSLRFIPLVTSDQIEALRSNAIDIGFLTGPLQRDDLLTRVVQTDKLVAVIPEGHRLSGTDPIAVGELAEEAFVVGEQRQWTHFLVHVNALCQRHGFLPRVIQEAKDSSAILGLVAAGIGITLSIERFAARGPEGCVWLDLADDHGDINTLLVWHSRPRNPVVEHFVAVSVGVAGRDDGQQADV